MTQMVDHFILSAIDPTLGCPVLEALIPSPDVDALRTLVGIAASEDPDGYILDPDEARSVARHFGTAFEPADMETVISRVSSDLSKHAAKGPHLNHTGIELFLMLNETKPFAMLGFPYPANEGDDKEESLFEPHVQAGRITKRAVVEVFDKPVRGYQGRSYDGYRALYYSLPGEEWRVDAYLLLRRQAKFAAWDEVMERMEGSLLGYTDAENDWWIARLRYDGRIPWGLTTVYAVVSAHVLDWTRSTGFRALPWHGPQPAFWLQQRWQRPGTAELNGWMELAEAAAVLRLGLDRDFLMNHAATGEDGSLSYRIPADAVPALNEALRRRIDVICERDSNMIVTI